MFEKGFPLFWYNPDKKRGFRLTRYGLEAMENLHYKSFTFFITKLNSYDIVRMDKEVTHPWFASGMGSLTIFYEPMAVALNLTNSDVDRAINIVYC